MVSIKHNEKEIGFANVVPVSQREIKSENLYETKSPKNRAAKETTSIRNPFRNPLYAYQQRGIKTIISIQFTIYNY